MRPTAGHVLALGTGRGRATASGNLTRPAPCPPGYYCPAGTAQATDNPCPAGTFNNRTLLAAAAQCANCTGGGYCETPGLAAPTAPCAASRGFFPKVGNLVGPS